MALGAAVVLALCAQTTRAAAQDCRTRDVDPCADLPASVDITSLSGDVTSNSAAQVLVLASDDHAVGTVTVTLNGSGGPASGSLGWISQPLSRGGTLTFTLQPGLNTITAVACDDSGTNPCASASVQITYNAPPPPPARQAPVLSVASHNAWHSAALHSATLGYSTPAYVSMNQQRSVSLVYASNQAHPLGFVQVDAVDNSTDAIQHMSITVRDSAGVVVAPERFYVAGLGANRLAAQWDASSLPTGAYMYTVEVKSYWATGSALSTTIQARVIVLNEALPFGRGWSLAGLKRVIAVGNDALVVNGDGTASYYERVNLAYQRPAGETATLGLAAGLGNMRQAYPDGSFAHFTNGRLIYTSDRFGNQTTYWYGAGGRVDSIIDPAGRVTAFTYASGKLTQITTPKGSSTFVVDTAGNLTTTGSFQAHYLSDGRLSYWLDQDQERWDVSYDDFERVDSIISPTVTADSASVRLVTAVRSLPAAVLPAVGSGTTRGTAVARRQPGSVRVVVTDPRGIQTSITVDRFGNPTYVEEPLGVWTSISRNENGLPTHVTDHRGGSQSYSWTPRGQMVSSSNSATGQNSSIAYDTITPGTGLSAVVPVAVNTNGLVQEFALGSNGEALAVVFAGDTVQTMTYDGLGRLATVTDAEGYQTSYFYGASAPMNTDSVRATTALGTQTSRFTYDAAGWVESQTNPLGETTTVARDHLNREYLITDPLGRETEIEYASPDRVVTDASGKSYLFGYNAVGWQVVENDPESRSVWYEYDRGGNVIARTDRRGLRVTFAYDSLNRVVTRTADGLTTTYAYDNPYGRWIAASNPESTDTIHFDAFGRDTLTVKRMGGQRYAVRSGYHPNGVRTNVDIRSPFQRSVAYLYNPNTMRLEGIRDIGGDTTEVRYNVLGQVTKQVFPGAIGERRYYYNERQLPTNVWYSSPTLHNTLMRDYEFDDLDRIERMRYRYNDTTTVFSYDALGQLASRKSYHISQELQCVDPMDDTTCSYVDIYTLNSDQAFAYDSVGNRTDSGASLEATSNRYATFGGYTFTYDDDGNLLTKATLGFSQSFSWNSLGQLSSVTTNGTTVNYGYDGWGVRVRRTEGGTVTRYLYDGDNLLIELDGSGNPFREYTYLPGVDQPHHVRTGGVDYYYAQDLLGNVIGAFSSGGVALHRGNLPFGALTGSTGSLSQPLGFKARELDASSGLYYVRNRWYDPAQGRFVSEDPIGIEGGLNVYRFALNDPINQSDPAGLSPWCNPWMLIEMASGTKKVRHHMCDYKAGYEDWVDNLPWGNQRRPTQSFGGGQAGLGGSVGAAPAATASEKSCAGKWVMAGLSAGADAFTLVPGVLAIRTYLVTSRIAVGASASLVPVYTGRGVTYQTAEHIAARNALRVGALGVAGGSTANAGIATLENSSWARALPLYGTGLRLGEAAACSWGG